MSKFSHDKEKQVAQEDPTEIDDKTRIIPPSVSKEDDADATRIMAPKPAETDQDGKTRIAPRRTNPKAAVNTTLRSEVSTSAPPETPSKPTGTDTVLKERFVLQDVLGAGGMGVVYKALDRLKVEAQDRDPYVAIKVLGNEFKQHPEAFIALQRESRKSQSIAHPNIVNVFDFDRDSSTVFMTMEFMEGEPLDKLLRRYRSIGLPSNDAWQIIKDMCAALSHAHDENIIHSDFKPGNVFVTNRGVTKVFDFGIARAVAKVHYGDDNSNDNTVFDAGNLGALTPAYASLEMLSGKEPDVRDDLYALGCVIYEIFTGEHPFNKLPADQAMEKGLKPKRITNITKQQWNAIEQSLAFKREDRIGSANELLERLTKTNKPTYTLSTALALLFAVAITIYFLYFQEKPEGISKDDIRSELEYEIRLDLYKNAINELLSNASFSNIWERDLWSEVQTVRDLLTIHSNWSSAADQDWLLETEQKIILLYVDKITPTIQQGQFDYAQRLLTNGQRYEGDRSALEAQAVLLAERMEQAKLQRSLVAQPQEIEVIEKEDSPPPEPKPKVTRSIADQFLIAQKNVKSQLSCRTHLNTRELNTAVLKLRSIDSARYALYEPQLIREVAACIGNIGRSNPERATDYKKFALRLFNNSGIIAAIKITPQDPCRSALAGLGARARSTCKDKLVNKASGPILVVIPGKSAIKSFALGKYEVSISEINQFCRQSSSCQTLRGDGTLPATGVSIATIKGYIRWLNQQSKQRYRLPNKQEWIHAAQAGGSSLDPNRNCQLSSRGINKGQGLVKVSVGKQNSWGVVNHVGNAREFAYDQGRKLIAIGGSYENPMGGCNINTQTTHKGEADKITGFRLLRELRGG